MAVRQEGAAVACRHHGHWRDVLGEGRRMTENNQTEQQKAPNGSSFHVTLERGVRWS
jgi:hypothetical protein